MIPLSKKPKILLIEDHPDIVEMYALAFKKIAGIDLYLAYDKEGSMNQVNKVQPDLVLLDLIIPGEEQAEANSRFGFDVLKEIRKDKKLRDTPVLVLTNLDSPNDRKKAKQLHALDYIVKAEILPSKVVEKSLEVLHS